MTDTQVDTHKFARFTPLRERAVTLVAPEDLTPPEPKPRPMTPGERAAWRRQVRAAFAVVEADPDYHYGLTPPVFMLADPYPAMEFVVRGYEKLTGKMLLHNTREVGWRGR